MSPWIPVLYQYLVGGTVACATLYVAFKQGALSLDSREDRQLACVLLLGMGLFALVHTLWTWSVLR
jgi:hypothetical protein